jgi:bifunctional non-homologous end joining protein LigD
MGVQVEDHPLAYGGFKGLISQGQYGGGPVKLRDQRWSEGEIKSDFRNGRLSFKLTRRQIARRLGAGANKGQGWRRR